MDKSELAKLTKNERKAYFKEERKLEELASHKKTQIKKWFIILTIVIVGILGSWLLIKELTKPVPGTIVADLGRDHVPKEKWEKFKYNSNPPTSGPHDVDWIKAGAYASPQGDGFLVHSLEHGYIIISYDCTKLNSKVKSQNSKLIPKAYAHEGEEESIAPSAQTGESLGKEWETKECKGLAHTLSDFAEEKGTSKLIVVPRPKMDVPIALTAWIYIEKLNIFDKEKISRFIDAHRDHGPEKTME